MMKRIFCIFLGIVLAGGAWALSLETLLPDTLVQQLVKTGAVNRDKFDTTETSLAPRYAALERLLNSGRSSINPNIAVESLRLYKKPSSAEWTSRERADLYNGILALSTLKGLLYYSKSHDQMRVLYESSTVIDGPDTKNPRPDPVYAAPAAETSVFARQTDVNFGDNTYKFTYYADSSSFIVVQENITSLTYGIVPIVDKNKLRSTVAIFDCGPYLLIYAASLAKTSMVPGMKQRAGESLNRKADALLAWFQQKADRAFAAQTSVKTGGKAE
jgi:hypothetical protein